MPHIVAVKFENRHGLLYISRMDKTSNQNSQIALEAKAQFRFWLQRQFTERCKRNPRYSLRAFAKSLSVEASSLSQILSGKRPISKKNMQALCEKLGASPQDLFSFGLSQSGPTDFDVYNQISIDSFSIISDWYHFAILELTFISGFKSDPKWIARKLSITVEEVKSAIERMKRLGLLLEENGSLVKSAKFMTNQSSVNTSLAHKQLQRQIIEKALLAIDECPGELKDITSMTMAIDVSNLEKAKKLTQKYRRELCALLEEGEQTVVYNLGIQLYPISRNEENL